MISFFSGLATAVGLPSATPGLALDVVGRNTEPRPSAVAQPFARLLQALHPIPGATTDPLLAGSLVATLPVIEFLEGFHR